MSNKIHMNRNDSRHRAVEGQWFDRVPADWDAAPIKRNYRVQLGKMLRTEPSSERDTLEPYVRAANVQWSGVSAEDLNNMWFSPSEKTTYKLEYGDLVVSEGGDVGRSAIWEAPVPNCYIQNAVHRIRPLATAHNKFLYYTLYAIKQSGHFEVLCSKATIAHLTQEKLQEVPVPLPPLAEQQAIAAFLDRETARLDALIGRKERLLELLEEKRKAIISKAVTRGLDASVPLKDSGVEWLGQVPEGWTLPRLADVTTQITNGYVGPTRDILVSDGVRYLQSLHIKNGKVLFDKPYYVTAEWNEEHRKSKLMYGHVVIVQTGDLGQCCAIGEDFVGSNCHALIIAKPIHELSDGFFISYLLRSSYGYDSLLALKTGATHPHLDCGNVREIKLPLPPFSEQQAIASYLDTQTAKFDALREKLELSAAKLREYRTSLISAAVTGKIDVRSEVPQLTADSASPHSEVPA